MLPICYPSSPSPTTGLPEAVAYALSSVSGLTRWVDYIPVKLVGSPLGMNEQTTNLNGFVPMRLLGSAIGMAAWSDYIPVYVDNSATEAWVTSATGYIPYANSVLGATTPSVPSFYFNFSNPQNVTLGAVQARGNITSTQNAVIAASVSPSRTTGVAPLYVNFDATGTTSTLSANPSHELFFAHDFGDAGAGTWANGVQSSGLTSKNAGYGPVTGHVYETPGTYTVQMVVTDGVNTATKTGTIVVQDPNTVYAGALTICISHSGNFTGAPSGAAQVNTAGNTDMYAAWNTYKASNKRILFCKADTWTASATVDAGGLSNMIVGGYGTGAAHTFASGTLVSVTPNTGIGVMFQGGGANDVKFCEFKIAANATHYGCAATNTTGINVTWYKIETRGAYAGFSITTGPLSMNSLYKQPGNCIYECLVDQLYGYAGLPTDTPRVTGASASNGSPCIFTSTGHPFKRFNRVRLSGTAPTGLNTSTDYYISASNLTANTFSLTASITVDTPLASSSTATCDVTAKSLGGGMGAFVSMTNGGIMGSYFDNGNNGEQVIRIPYFVGSHINNNYLARPNQGKNILKIQSRLYENIVGVSSGYSEKLSISGNIFSLRGGYSLGAAIPNNGQTATRVGEPSIIMGFGNSGEGGDANEYCRNIIVEQNFTRDTLGSPTDNMIFIAVNCPNVTVRNNIADFSKGDRSTGFAGSYSYTWGSFASITTSTPGQQTTGVRIYNNTMYSNLSNAERFYFVRYIDSVYTDADDITIKNNLYYTPFHSNADRGAFYNQNGAAGPTLAVSNNSDTVAGSSVTPAPGFVAQPPVLLTDWRPNTGSYAIGTGAALPVMRDFNNVTRVGAGNHLGAVLP